MSDSSIIATADDAISAKFAAVQSGYYQDPFLSPFITHPRPVQPIIKRGTHARVKCMDRIINAFIQTHDNPHIVVLGAGKDTSFFRCASGLLMSPVTSSSRILWYEVDHPSVISTKARIIKMQSNTFQASVTNGVNGGYLVTSTSNNAACHLIGHDLRESPTDLLLKLPNLKPSSDSILFVLECVQMYLLESSSRALLHHIRDSCPNASLALYDPMVGIRSSFGTVMEQHLLRANKVSLQSSLCMTRTLSQHLKKLVETCGWYRAVGCDMWWAYQTMLSDSERATANRCEFLDEVEEWQLIMQHYCIIVACTTRSEANFCQTGPLLGMDATKCETKTLTS